MPIDQREKRKMRIATDIDLISSYILTNNHEILYIILKCYTDFEASTTNFILISLYLFKLPNSWWFGIIFDLFWCTKAVNCKTPQNT
jgi:hypothetical protein